MLATLRAASGDETALAAKEAHYELRFHTPVIDEIGTYRKNEGAVMAQAVQKCAESLLYLRTKPLKRGLLKTQRRDFQEEVEMRLCDSVRLKDGKHRKEFGKLALSFSRLFALYYVDENERQPKKLEGRLEKVLPSLAEHLLAELELCIEARFTNPSNNLCKVSVFDIQEKLDMLESHADEVVRRNAPTIVCAALNFGNLGLADTLAKGAKEKLDDLQKHADEIVRRNAPTIVHAALNRGNLGLADELAKGAAKAYDELKKRLGENAGNVKTLFSMMLNKGTLDVEEFLKAAA